MAAKITCFLSSLLFLVLSLGISAEYCTYYIGVVTSRTSNAGTNSTISMQFYNADYGHVNIPNLREYGRAGPTHKYFQSGGYDTFRIHAPCLNSQICRVAIQSDGTGDNPEWHPEYVLLEVKYRSTQYFLYSKVFDVFAWITKDNGFDKNYCVHLKQYRSMD